MLSSILTVLISCFTLWVQHLRHLPVEEAAKKALTRFLVRLSPRPKDAIGLWIDNLEPLVLALSDQQLLTGLLLLVCAYGKYWQFSVHCGGNNLWNAADVVCFSSLTHAATLLTLRSYFRRHRTLAFCRVVVMYIIYILWLVIIVQILKPEKTSNASPKLPGPTSKFWHAASYIEAIGIMGLYIITYLPIFFSKEAMRVRICIAMNPDELQEALNDWRPYRRDAKSWFKEYSRTDRMNLYKVIRSSLTRFAVEFSKAYVKQGRSSWNRNLLWIASEILLPFYVTPFLLIVLWAFGLGFMGFKVSQNNLSVDWSFGQLLPPMLVVLPLQSFIGSFAGMLTTTYELLYS